eukprot:4276249-Amphidinium_carterae.1
MGRGGWCQPMALGAQLHQGKQMQVSLSLSSGGPSLKKGLFTSQCSTLMCIDWFYPACVEHALPVPNLFPCRSHSLWAVEDPRGLTEGIRSGSNTTLANSAGSRIFILTGMAKAANATAPKFDCK